MKYSKLETTSQSAMDYRAISSPRRKGASVPFHLLDNPIDREQLHYPLVHHLTLGKALGTVAKADPALVLSSGSLSSGTLTGGSTLDYLSQIALAKWNQYLIAGEQHCNMQFQAVVQWLLENRRQLAPDVIGWPTLVPLGEHQAVQPVLSAVVQSRAVSVLARGYRATGEQACIEVARRAIRSFELDILDGGVCAPVGHEGLTFEEYAVYPASHSLKGILVALIGLDDYLVVTGDTQVAEPLHRGHATLHSLLDAFDAGYWTRSDLLHARLSTRAELHLHAEALSVFAQRTCCHECERRARRWADYRVRPGFRLQFLAARAGQRSTRFFLSHARRHLIGDVAPERNHDFLRRVCVPITAFPVAGGTRAVVAGIADVMQRDWSIDYLTQHVGQHAEAFSITQFGNKLTTPWQFPNVWFYAFAGFRKLLSHVRRGEGYHLLLPQDGVYTGAFTAVAGRLLGIRVVCIDHGNVTLPTSEVFREERRRGVDALPWPARPISRARLALYWFSLHLLMRIATRYTDCLLPAGDDVEEIYRTQLHAPVTQIMRFPFVINTDRFAPLGPEQRAEVRGCHGFAPDDVIITLINRLAPEKGLDTAVQGLHRALAVLPEALRSRIRIIIGGDGPMRSQLEAEIQKHELNSICLLWGNATVDEVAVLLSISDVFLYTSTRGITPVTILEAMAASCTVIATLAPKSNARLLAQGRGVVIPAQDTDALASAIAQVVSDPVHAREMGRLARQYVIANHNAEALRRAMLRATYYVPRIADTSRESGQDTLDQGSEGTR